MKRVGRSAKAADSESAQEGSTPSPAAPSADHRIGGAWGNHISLWKWDEFEKTDLNRHPVKVYGHMTPRPKLGQTVVMECVKSWVKFRISTIEYMRDPGDMFFAELRAIDQVWKE